jgi:hypothetical protein
VAGCKKPDHKTSTGKNTIDGIDGIDDPNPGTPYISNSILFCKNAYLISKMRFYKIGRRIRRICRK